MKLTPKVATLVLVLVQQATATPARFFGWPAEVFQGDAVVFTFRNDNPDSDAVRLDQLVGWRWDFNGDGVWDEEKFVGDSDPNTGLAITAQAINTTWYATYDEVQAVNGVQKITPRLQVRRVGDGDYVLPPQIGVTENVIGPAGVAPDPDTQIAVKSRSVGDANITVNFSSNPRLAQPGETIRFYSNVKFAVGKTGTIQAYAWDFDGNGSIDSIAANPTATYSSNGAYTVKLSVTYTLSGSSTVITSQVESKTDYIRIQSVPESLQLGRAYRRGFPATLSWEDIIQSYSALGAGNNRYVYYNHLENSFFNLQGQMVQPVDRTPARKREMAETLNELLQGQLLIANQRLVEALRIKYPRLSTNIDPNDANQRLNPPAGARTETAAIDQALLDYQLPLYYTGTALQLYGTDILRVKAADGAEPYPQFPHYLTFLDSSLSQTPIPIKNEYWQLTTAFERMGLGRVEKAKKLYRLSAQDSTALAEAKSEAKTAGLHSYLGMAVLAAGQEERDYQQNEGNTLLANMKNARDLFERINAGLNPLGNDGSFIPNESFAATYQDAQEAIADARESEINARQEDRTWEQYQASLRDEQLAQRNNYITPLKNLTSIDPALYNDLRTVDDQRDYRAAVQGRVEAILKDYPNANPAIAGELGSNVIGVLDAQQATQQALNDLGSLFEKIEIVKWSNKQIENIDLSTNAALLASDVLLGLAQAQFSQTNGTSNSTMNWLGAASFSLSKQMERAASVFQRARVADIQLESEIRNSLLQQANLGIAIDRSRNQLSQAQLALDNQLSRMDRLIEDLAHTRETAADLYFQDPSFKVVVSNAMRRADGELDYAIDRLFRMAKTLEYEWTEAYQNPLVIPVNSQEPASLENPLFDKFTKTDSLFFIRTADEAKDYLDALKAWDSKLRRINVTSVRGPNHSGPISAEPISMRETILNLKPDATRGYTLDQSIRDFRNYLETKRKANFFNSVNPSLEIPFATTIEDNRFFPATGSRWNMRVNSIAVDVYAESGFSNKQVAEIDFIQSGVVSLRRYWANPPTADDLTRLTFNVDNINRTAFSVAFPARINGATGGRPPAEFDNLGLANRPIAATNWILRINTDNPTNQAIDFSKIKDIVIRYTYTYGNPPEFPNF